MQKNLIGLLFLLAANFAIAAPPTLKSESEYRKDSQQICAKKWTKRGELDQRMYNHCLGGQDDGYAELNVQVSQYGNQAFFSNVSYGYCSEKWTERGVANTRMIAHCLGQEIEGWKDVEYFRKQYGTEKVNPIVSEALADYSSWNMAAYTVKNQFE
jgi:hypothetical protein